MKIQITLPKIPKKCGECKFYSEGTYQCHNESGTEPSCSLGFMDGEDLRDHSYFDHLYPGCNIKKLVIKKTK